jgi:hypothetical protein
MNYFTTDGRGKQQFQELDQRVKSSLTQLRDALDELNSPKLFPNLTAVQQHHVRRLTRILADVANPDADLLATIQRTLQFLEKGDL